MNDDFDDFWVHTITVTPYLGSGANGKKYGPTTDVSCFIDGGVKVASDSDGKLIVANAPVYAPISAASVLTAESKVVMPDGRVVQILAATMHTSGDLDLPDHVEITLV